MSGITSSIIRLVIKEKNLKMQPTLVTFVEIDQFGGHPLENLNVHLHSFLKKHDTIKLNGVPNGATRLRVFPFSLKDRAREQLQNKVPNLFST